MKLDLPCKVGLCSSLYLADNLFTLKVSSFSLCRVMLLVNKPVQRTKMSGEYEKGVNNTPTNFF